ncbi:RDD family protein [Puia dinghuensis]|uniref:RDD domain-containing protein n=1 Tax=Puia dinghuensis TaxID=1792502 RepID=A0A8J2XTQ8_9BACT|nr:RDD family protein [Puia dinghuensis]GGB19586.1 hypothetical protein GCM10011511_49160 [Puia dinghuensis]
MENTYPPTDTTEHVLDDIEYTYLQARGSLRFTNWIVDRLVFFGLWRLLLYFFTYPLARFLVAHRIESRGLFLLFFFCLAILVFVAYFTVFEAATGGKTPGKFITRTRAVTADGFRITVRTALLRSLCRVIPLEAFSALGNPSYPWHDRLTKTLVVDEKLTQLPPWD